MKVKQALLFWKKEAKNFWFVGGVARAVASGGTSKSSAGPALSMTRQHPEFAAACPNLSPDLADAMRNMFAHGYFDVDLGITGTTRQTDLPAIRDNVAAIMTDLK